MLNHDSSTIIHLCYIVSFAVLLTQLFNYFYLRYVLSGIYDGNGGCTFHSQSFQIKLYSAFLLMQTLLLNGFIVYLNLFYFRDTFDYGKLIFWLGINFWIYKISESLIKGLNKSPNNLTISLSKYEENPEFIKINRTKVQLKKPVNYESFHFDGERIYLSAGKWVEIDDLGIRPYRYAIYNLLKSHDKELNSSSHIVHPLFIGIKIILYSILLIFGILATIF